MGHPEEDRHAWERPGAHEVAPGVHRIPLPLPGDSLKAVNVYVTVTGGNELFLRQVAANTVEKVPVTGVATGSTVTFKAVTVDGSRTYQSRSSPLSTLFLWSVP